MYFLHSILQTNSSEPVINAWHKLVPNHLKLRYLGNKHICGMQNSVILKTDPLTFYAKQQNFHSSKAKQSHPFTYLLLLPAGHLDKNSLLHFPMLTRKKVKSLLL